jgi:hypothetical protein
LTCGILLAGRLLSFNLTFFYIFLFFSLASIVLLICHGSCITVLMQELVVGVASIRLSSHSGSIVITVFGVVKSVGRGLVEVASCSFLLLLLLA